MIPVLLAGGSGTRLWPLSTPHIPKPFAPLFDGASLFDKTLERVAPLSKSPFTLATKSLEPLIQESYQRHGLSKSGILSEPTGRNTAPAMAFLASYFSLKGLEDEVLGVFPSDHLIADSAAYLSCLKKAESVARQGKLALLGILPTGPATGFGYIEAKSVEDNEPQPIMSFREKPNLSLAGEFIAAKKFFWNSGQFIVSVKTLRHLFETHAPEILKPFKSLKEDLSNLGEIYEQLPSISFDHAVVEKVSGAAVTRCDAGWSDLGSWDDMAAHLKSAPQWGATDESNFIFSEAQKPTAIIGLKDLIVADTKEGLLITKKGESQKVKDLPPPENPQREVRPWGYFEILSDLSNLKTKIITVLPGHSLSYQSHTKRDELWVVLAGTAEVTLDDKVHKLTPGESIKILRGQKHRMTNSTQESLKFFELQTGEYFGEDDIKRYEDRYGRSTP